MTTRVLSALLCIGMLAPALAEPVPQGDGRLEASIRSQASSAAVPAASGEARPEATGSAAPKGAPVGPNRPDQEEAANQPGAARTGAPAASPAKGEPANGTPAPSGSQTPAPATGDAPPADRLRQDGVGRTGRPIMAGPITLRTALEIGLANSLGVSLATSDMQAAQASTLEAGADGRVALSTDFQKLRGDPNRMWDASPGLSSGLSTSGTPESMGMVRAKVSYPLFGGAFRQRMAVAEMAEKQAMARLALAFRDSARKIRRAYFQVLLERERLATAEWEVTRRQELLKVAQAHLARGKVAQFVVNRHQAELAAAQQRVNLARAALVSAEASLKTTLGIEVTSSLDYLDAFESPPAPPGQEDCLARALEDRPDLVAARYGVQESDLRIDLAHAEYGLQLSVGAQYSTLGNGGLDSSYTGQYSGGLSLSMPIFDGGNHEAEVNKAEALKKSREVQLADMELEVTRQVVDVRARLEAALANLDLSQNARVQADEDLRIATLRNEVGQGQPTEVLDTLAATARVRLNAVQAEYDASVAYADLLYVTGKF